MISRESTPTIETAILEKYKQANLNSGPNRSIDQRVILMFETMLDFIILHEWRYVPDGNQDHAMNILKRGKNKAQHVNCFDLTDIFLELCKRININNCSKLVFDNKPLRPIGENIGTSNVTLKCFDKNARFSENKALFDNHCVARVNGRYYDLVFSAHYQNLNDTFDDRPIAKLTTLISCGNEDAAIRLLACNDFDSTQLYQGLTILHWSVLLNMYNLTCHILNKYPNLSFVKSSEAADTPHIIPIEMVHDDRSKLFRSLASKLERNQVIRIKSRMATNIKVDMNNQKYLSAAKRSMSIRTINSLISRGFNLRYSDYDGLTLLHHAVINKNHRVIEHLLTLDPDLANIKDSADQLPIEHSDCAQVQLSEKLVRATKHHITQNILYMNAAEKIINHEDDEDCIRCVCNMLNYGLDIDKKNSDGWTLLHFATFNNRANIVITLLRQGADFKLANNDNDYAIDLSTPESDIHNILLDHTFIDAYEADPQNELLKTAMTMIAHDDLHGIRDLISIEGLDVNLQDEHGDTMLHKAVIYENREIVSWLTENNASLHITNNNDEKPLEICVSHSSNDIREILNRYSVRNTRQSRRNSMHYHSSDLRSNSVFPNLQSEYARIFPPVDSMSGPDATSSEKSPPPPPTLPNK